MKYKTLHDNEHLYFLTSRISGFKEIFYQDKYALIALNCLAYLRKQKYIYLFSFCIMPDHIHVLLKVQGKNTINIVVNKFHSFTAHKFLEQLRKEKDNILLNCFKDYAIANKKDRQYYFWEDALVKNVYSMEALNGVMEYIHSNPCNKKWHLVENRADYKYSSACFYDKGIKPIIEVDDISKFYK